MKSISLADFEAHCHLFLEQVEKSGEPLVLLKNGKAFTRILPCTPKKKSLFGRHKGQIEVHGDILAPLEAEWDAMK